MILIQSFVIVSNGLETRNKENEMIDRKSLTGQWHVHVHCIEHWRKVV